MSNRSISYTILIMSILTSIQKDIYATVGNIELPEKKMIITPFDYHHVKLNDGKYKDMINETIDYYLSIPNDDLLKGFRERNGKPAPGNDLGGWYSDGTFHIFGQIISGLSRLYAGTGNMKCKIKANKLVDEWSKCIEPDGYFFAGKPNALHYIYDKMLGGLLDNYKYCNNKKALKYMEIITDWAIINLDRSNAYGFGYTEWYTLSENSYRAYTITGNKKYPDFAKVWEYTEYWDIFAKKEDILDKMPSNPPYYHAYSHVNTLCGLGAAYSATGTGKYLNTLIYAYDYLQENHIWPTDGFGPNENLLNKERMIDTLTQSHNHFETQCGTWAGFKISKYLLSFTGDSKYGNWIEKLIINGIGAGIPPTADGRVFYYADYNIDGGSKRHIDIQWSCCMGTRPMAIADFHDIIYFKDSNSIYVNLFIPSTVNWEKDGIPIRIEQITDFPEAANTEFIIQIKQPVDFYLKLRLPDWIISQPRIRVNNNEVNFEIDDKNWLTIHRKWNNEDKISFEIPMDFTISKIDKNKDYPSALLYGPVVMAAQKNPTGMIDLKDPKSSLRIDETDKLTYRLVNDEAVTEKPFYSYKQNELYYMFLGGNRTGNKSNISHIHFTYTKDWHISSIHHTKTKGAFAEYEFSGSGITLEYLLFDDAGKTIIEIDGTQAAVIDQYNRQRETPAKWESMKLPSGAHKIKIIASGEKNPESSDTYINIKAISIDP